MTAVAAVAIRVVLGALAVFQLLLIAGRPLGRFAWGGQHMVLPTNRRAGSAVSIVLDAVFAIIALERARLTDFIPGETFIAVAMWVITIYFAVGVVMNVVSKRKPERFTMAPTSLVLAVLGPVITIG